ncbi:MAG: glucose-6-phosphate isomerase [bacterium]|nr:MAG: glucose-6-phosphate isomerase [bacterium]
MITLDTKLLRPHLGDDDIAHEMPHAIEALRSILRRECVQADMLGWLDLPGTGTREIGAIADTAKRIQDENDCLVVIGIGGSYLGARAAIEALPDSARFPVHFAGNNLSPEYHERLLATLSGKRFTLCVISKSGTTTEPAVAFRILKAKLIEAFGSDHINNRIIVITDPSAGALRSIAGTEGYMVFPIPPGVGGRFSVLSAVGLVPCAVAGISIREMLRGAEAALGRYSKPLAENDALRYAVIRNLLHRRRCAVEVLSTFHPELTYLCEWWKQLAGESEGKKGKGLYPASAVMTTDLHSLGQYLQEGARIMLETFLVATEPRRDIAVPPDTDDLDNLNYLAGRPMSEINRKAFEGTVDAHASGGLPVLSIEVPVINVEAIGSLFVFFEMSIAVSGLMLGINPFDQPGVEEYKRRMFNLLGKPGVE